MEKIIIIGGGGHSKVLIDLIQKTGKYEIAGILDPNIDKGTEIAGVSVVGDDAVLDKLSKKGINKACLGVGSIRDNAQRAGIYSSIKNRGFCFPSLLHPESVVAQSVKIFDGAQVMSGVIIQADSVIGENTILNTRSVIDHDCKIDNNVHICPGVVLSGGVTVGDGAFVGAGSTVIQGVKIGKNAVIGAGAVVVKDVLDGEMVKGVPAR